MVTSVCCIAPQEPKIHVKLIIVLILYSCLIGRTTLTSASAPNDKHDKTCYLCVNPGISFWNTQEAHEHNTLYVPCTTSLFNSSSSGIRADVIVVLEERQSIESHFSINVYEHFKNVGCISRLLTYFSHCTKKILWYSDCQEQNPCEIDHSREIKLN